MAKKRTSKTKRGAFKELQTAKTLSKRDLQVLEGGTKIIVSTDPSNGSISIQQGIRKGGR